MNQAFVTLNGKCRYLGVYDSPASREKYDRLIAEWLVSGRQAPAKVTHGLSVNAVLLRFFRHAEENFRDRDGQPTREPANFKAALKQLRRLYVATDAALFGPLAFRAIIKAMIAEDLLARGAAGQLGAPAQNTPSRLQGWRAHLQMHVEGRILSAHPNDVVREDGAVIRPGNMGARTYKATGRRS